MRKIIVSLTAVSLGAALAAPAQPAAPGQPAEEQLGLTVGPYYRASIPLAGDPAESSWAGGAARGRYEWTEAFAVSAAFAYDRHELPESESILEDYDPGEVIERRLLSLRGGMIYNLPLGFTYPYAGGGVVLAREKTYFRSGDVEPRILYHPGLYGEAGTYVPLAGPLVVDAGPELTLLFGKMGGDRAPGTGDYRDEGGAALYFGFKAGVGIFF
jgi:hypothetical protein